MCIKGSDFNSHSIIRVDGRIWEIGIQTGITGVREVVIVSQCDKCKRFPAISSDSRITPVLRCRLGHDIRGCDWDIGVPKEVNRVALKLENEHRQECCLIRSLGGGDGSWIPS